MSYRFRNTAGRPWFAGVLLSLILPTPPLGAAEAIQLISRRGEPAPMIRTGAGPSLSAVPSGDGRYVVFSSAAPDLVPNDAQGPVWDVFRRDLARARTERVSSFVAGSHGSSRDSTDPSVTHDGEQVAFVSLTAPGLEDTNRVADVFVRRMTNAVPELVSVRSDGRGSGNGASGPAVISSDGRFVVFESLAADLVGGIDTNHVADVFLRDLAEGTTVLLSGRPDRSGVGNGASSGPLLVSADASVIAFRSAATDLVPTALGNVTDLYFWTRADGVLRRVVLPGSAVVTRPGIVRINNAVLARDGRHLAFRAVTPGTSLSAADGVWWADLVAGSYTQISTNRDGTGVNGADDSTGPVFSGDGTVLAFEEAVGPGSAAGRQIRIWRAGAGRQSLEDLAAGHPATAAEPTESMSPILDAQGGRLAFLSQSGVPGTPVTESGPWRLFVRELATGVTATLPVGVDGTGWEFPFAEFTPDGSRVLFQSDAVLASDVTDGNRAFDVFLASVGAAAVEVVSLADPAVAVSTPPGPAVLSTAASGVSANGRYVLLGRSADGGIGTERNVYRFDRETGTSMRISRAPDGGAANGPSTPVALSDDGRYALFQSYATNLVAGDGNGVEDLFRADLGTGTIELVNAKDGGMEFGQRAPLGGARLSADGRQVAFLSPALDLVPGLSGSGNNLFLRDTETRRTFCLSRDNAANGVTGIQGKVRRFVLGRSGRWAAFLTGAGNATGAVQVYDHHEGALFRMPLTQPAHALAISESRGIVAAAAPVPGSSDIGIHLLDLATRTLTDALRLPAGSTVDSLRFSVDGSALLFITAAPVPSNLTGIVDDNGTRDVFVFELATGRIRHCSVDPLGGAGVGEVDPADLSADGRRVVFGRAPMPALADLFSEATQVYSHDLTVGRTTLVSTGSLSGPPGNGHSTFPDLSDDGETVVFATTATDLVAGEGNGMPMVLAVGLGTGASGDVDRDGLPDEWERLRFGHLDENAGGDPDRDRQSNAAEYQADTDPTDPASVFRIEIAGAEGLEPSLRWASVSGILYVVEYAGSPEAMGFAPISSEIRGDGSTKNMAVGRAGLAGYFRVRVRRE